jgi:class 3 adenylate cyclase
MTSGWTSIEYVPSQDGTLIGFRRAGSGPVIVWLPPLGSCLRLRDLLPSLLSLEWGELVVYDRRGVGYSDRDSVDSAIDTALADLSAVVTAVGPEPVTLYASWDQGPVAMRFAAEYGHLVSHLFLDSTFATGSDYFGAVPQNRAMRAVLEEDWDSYLRITARVGYNLDRPLSDEVEALLGEEMSHEATLANYAATAEYDSTAWLSQITAPTLLVQRTLIPAQLLAHRSLQALAMQIPNSSLVRCDTEGDITVLARRFIDVAPPDETHGVFRTVMFTDLVSSTALTQRIGDDAAQQIVEAHDDAVRAALTEHKGVEIKHTGDGIMAAFDSAAGAARAAQQLVTRLRGEGVGVRVGLNAGEPIERDGDLFGTSVQLAARVCDAAAEGQLLVTQVVRALTEGKGLSWSQAPAVDAKGFDEPISVFSLDFG